MKICDNLYLMKIIYLTFTTLRLKVLAASQWAQEREVRNIG